VHRVDALTTVTAPQLLHKNVSPTFWPSSVTKQMLWCTMHYACSRPCTFTLPLCLSGAWPKNRTS